MRLIRTHAFCICRLEWLFPLAVWPNPKLCHLEGKCCCLFLFLFCSLFKGYPLFFLCIFMSIQFQYILIMNIWVLVVQCMCVHRWTTLTEESISEFLRIAPYIAAQSFLQNPVGTKCFLILLHCRRGSLIFFGRDWLIRFSAVIYGLWWDETSILALIERRFTIFVCAATEVACAHMCSTTIDMIESCINAKVFCFCRFRNKRPPTLMQNAIWSQLRLELYRSAFLWGIWMQEGRYTEPICTHRIQTKYVRRITNNKQIMLYCFIWISHI